MNSNLIVEKMIKRYNFNGYPEEYKVSLVDALDRIRDVFGDNLLNVTLGGSGGKNKIIDGLKQLKYPIYHLDFETFPCPLPRYSGEKPYTQSVFQFSDV